MVSSTRHRHCCFLLFLSLRFGLQPKFFCTTLRLLSGFLFRLSLRLFFVCLALPFFLFLSLALPSSYIRCARCFSLVRSSANSNSAFSTSFASFSTSDQFLLQLLRLHQAFFLHFKEMANAFSNSACSSSICFAYNCISSKLASIAAFNCVASYHSSSNRSRAVGAVSRLPSYEARRFFSYLVASFRCSSSSSLLLGHE